MEESFSFANSHGLAKVSVWDLSTPMTYMNVCRRISGSHLFHVTQKLLARAFDRCHTIYCDFLKEQEREASRVAPIQSDANANVPDQNEKIYDFDNPQPLPFSVPVSFSYFDEKKTYVNTWRDLYISALESLYDDYPQLFQSLKGKIFGTAKLPLIAGDDDKGNLRVPKEFAPGLYVELRRSAEDLMANLKRIIDLCNVDAENLRIAYKESSTDEPGDTATNENQSSTEANSRTIIDAITIVLHESPVPLTCQEIYDRIIEKGLYTFGAKDPVGVIATQIGRACKDSSYTSKRLAEDLFGFVKGENGETRFFLLSKRNGSLLKQDNDSSMTQPIFSTSNSMQDASDQDNNGEKEYYHWLETSKKHESLIQARINYKTFGAMDERFTEDVRKPEESELSGIDYVYPLSWYDPDKDVLYIRRYYVSQDGKLFSRMETLDWRFGSELTKWREKDKFPKHNMPVPYPGCVRLNFREAMRKLSTYELKHAVFTELMSRELSYIREIFGLTPEQMQRMNDDEACDFWNRLGAKADSEENLHEIADIIRERISRWAEPCWDIPDWITEW